MNNFPIKLGNKEYWISRSIAVCGFILSGELDNLSILAVKRGSGCSDEVGKWCCPCGYLDYNETLLGACVREIHEESSLWINRSDLKLWQIDDSALDNKQNVIISYWSYRPNYINVILSNDCCEPNEIDDIKWISLKDVSSFDWAFNHLSLINKLTNCLFGLNKSIDFVLENGIMNQLISFPQIIEDITIEKLTQIYNSLLNGN